MTGAFLRLHDTASGTVHEQCEVLCEVAAARQIFSRASKYLQTSRRDSSQLLPAKRSNHNYQTTYEKQPPVIVRESGLHTDDRQPRCI